MCRVLLYLALLFLATLACRNTLRTVYVPSLCPVGQTYHFVTMSAGVVRELATPVESIGCYMLPQSQVGVLGARCDDGPAVRAVQYPTSLTPSEMEALCNP